MYDPAGKGQAHSTKYHIRIGSDGTVLTQPLTWVMGAYDSKQCKYLTGFGHSGDGRTIRIVEFAIRNSQSQPQFIRQFPPINSLLPKLRPFPPYPNDLQASYVPTREGG